MKKIILFLLFYLATFLSVNAAVFTVRVSNFQFSPQFIPNVLVGDIIVWEWASGDHTTTSETIPAGAATWNSPMTSSTTRFQYTVTVPGTYDYICIPHAPEMAGSFIVSSVVPVLLNGFEAGIFSGKSILQWSTASEQNSAYFSIRKSINGTDFEEIGRVDAAGNSSVERFYTFTDEKMTRFENYAYYLILMVDRDGRSVYSPTRLVINGSARSTLITSVTPNPIRKPGHLMLKFIAERDGIMEARVVDMRGRVMLTTSLSAVKGINNGHIHLGDIPPGMYNMIFLLQGNKELRQIVVQ